MTRLLTLATLASLVFATVWLVVVARVLLPGEAREERQDRAVMVET